MLKIIDTADLSSIIIKEYTYSEVIDLTLKYLNFLLEEAEPEERKTYEKNLQDLTSPNITLKTKLPIALDLLESVNIYAVPSEK